jgi:hypothetical protein
MEKNVERIARQLLEFSEIINSFESEAVQEMVANFLLRRLESINRGQSNIEELGSTPESSKSDARSLQKRKTGIKILLDQLIENSFFDRERSIGDIIMQLKDLGNVFLANQVSGTLQALAKAGKLKRYHSPVNNRYVYIK